MFLTVNLAQDKSKHSRYLSNTLLDEIENTQKRGEKVLLYLNKRGSYNSLICSDCQYLWECSNCDTSLAVHSYARKLMCHLCGKEESIPHQCPKCSGNNTLAVGVGTQQIQETLEKIFPTSHIYRFDSDSMKTLTNKKEALLGLQEADIIIGTKMITTGFDFDKIGCIGVILVEQEFTHPYYNADEMAYINLRQCIGRGNRKSQKTSIILQTFVPKHETLKNLSEGSFKDFFSRSLKERKQFLYPPYGEMLQLEYRHKEESKALAFTEKLEQKLMTLDTIKSYLILRSSTTFKKNNSYHTSIIIKGQDIRKLLKPLESLILRHSELSLIFS